MADIDQDLFVAMLDKIADLAGERERDEKRRLEMELRVATSENARLAKDVGALRAELAAAATTPAPPAF